MNHENALFISDLHLTPTMPRTAQRFVDFCENEASKAEALFILGDLFEYWVGDDAHRHSPFHKEVVRQLKTLSDKGVKLYFMKGNRDFLIGPEFAQQVRWTELQDPSVVQIGGQDWLLCHGDSLCTADPGYQRFRKWVRRTWIQTLFLKLPVNLRKKIAQNLRSNSTASYQKTVKFRPDIANVRADVTKQACAELVNGAQCSKLIHGHTHRPGLFQEAYNDTSWKRWVLSDWDLDHPETVLPKASALQIDTNGVRELDLAKS